MSLVTETYLKQYILEELIIMDEVQPEGWLSGLGVLYITFLSVAVDATLLGCPATVLI